MKMVFIEKKMRRIKEEENKKIVIVKDRKEIDEKIKGKLKRQGFENKIKEESGEQMRKDLQGGDGKKVMKKVNKFKREVKKRYQVI